MKLHFSAIYSLLIIFFLSITTFGQDNSTVNDTVNVKKIKSIAINEISEESERVTQRILTYKDILVPSGTILEVDSLIKIAKVELQFKRDSLLIELSEISRRDLKIRKVEWRNYRSSLKSYQSELNDRTEEVKGVSDEIVKEIEKWELTKKELSANSSSTDVFDNLDKIIATLNEALKSATFRLEAIYGIEKNLTNIILMVDELIAEVKGVELKLKKDYFIFDSNPIWKLNDTTFHSEQIAQSTTYKDFTEQIKSNKNSVIEFFESNIKVALVQVLFLFLILFLLMAVKKKWIVKLSDLSNPIEIQAKIVLKNPYASTIIVGILITAFFYEALIPNVAEFFIFIILLGVIKTLPKLTNSKFVYFLVGLLALYIANIGNSYLNSHELFSRIILLIEVVGLYYILRFGRRLMKNQPDEFIRIYKLYNFISPFYILILFGSIIANCIGMVELAKFLFFGVLSSIILMMILYTSVKIFTSIVVLIFKLRKKYGIQAVSTIVDATHKRFQPILFWIGMFIWFFFTMKGFELLDFAKTWIDTILQFTWEVGEATISFGGILSFLAIFTITILIAKLAASIFQDEWMVSVLPRGVAPAISLILRILLIAIGFYIGVSAAGIDLSNLGFIIGALGVGIGFGLQNVVLNFVAGLILAFERPINLGDAIQVDGEFGVVTNIGVRSSNIRSYGGYEAIIPNGDLISKKVVNWTLSNRDRRSRKFLKTSPNVDPNKMIELFIEIAAKHPNTFSEPEPRVFFKGFEEDGNLLFELWYWSTFSDTLSADHDIQLEIFSKLKEMNVAAPTPTRRIIKD